jgi:hypothetical protein
MRKRQQAAKLLVDATQQDATMQDRWVVNEEWVRHLWDDTNGVGRHDLNAGSSAARSWRNAQFGLKGCLLLHDVKRSSKTPKRKRRRVSAALCQCAAT